MGECAASAPSAISLSARFSTLLSVPTDMDRRRERASAKPGRWLKLVSWLFEVVVPAEGGGEEPEPEAEAEDLDAEDVPEAPV